MNDSLHAVQTYNEKNDTFSRKLLKYDERAGDEVLLRNFQRGRGLPAPARRERGAPPPSVHDLEC
eukprot:15430172-Alexandrium_andersonii.AAC.1